MLVQLTGQVKSVFPESVLGIDDSVRGQDVTNLLPEQSLALRCLQESLPPPRVRFQLISFHVQQSYGTSMPCRGDHPYLVFGYAPFQIRRVARVELPVGEKQNVDVVLQGRLIPGFAPSFDGAPCRMTGRII